MKILSTIKPRRVFRKEFPFLLVFILCISTIVQAEISIRDNWDSDGKLFLEGASWKVEFRKEEGGLIISSNKKVLKILNFMTEILFIWK